MNHFAQARAKTTESLFSASYVLPSVLAVNTAALFALDALGGIPVSRLLIAPSRLRIYG